MTSGNARRVIASFATVALVGTLGISTPARAQLPGAKRVAILFAADGDVPEQLFDDLRRAFDAPIANAGFEPTPASDYADLVPEPEDAETARCFNDEECLLDLRDRSGVPILLLVELRNKGGKIAVVLRAWTRGTDSGFARARPRPLAKVEKIAVKAADAALRTLAAKLVARGTDSKRDMGANPPVVTPMEKKVPQPPAVAAPPAETTPATKEVAVTPAAEGSATPTATDKPKARYKYKPLPPEKSGFALEVGAWGGLVPLRYNRTHLVVGDRLAKQSLGDIGAGASLAFRIPWNKVDELFETNRFTYVIASPLTAWQASVGLEKRWKDGMLAPFIGGGMFLTSVSLPVPTASGGEQMASNMAIGGQGYGGVAVYLTRRIAVHARAGFSYSNRKLNQFDAGNTTYFARDVKGRSWSASVSGLLADVGVTFEI